MPTLHPFEASFRRAWPPEAWRDVTVLAAVSGGADSVALLRAMRALKRGGAGRLCASHFNHGLRGEESAADEAFVTELCRRLGVPCQVGRPPGGAVADDAGDGLEAAARAARYGFLQRAAARLGARYVVTAHTADDQAETILHRILRGTGVGGLAAMSRARALGPAATLLRPLLAFRRSELTAYLDDLGQSYRADSSNADTRLTRNRIRHELLPQLAAQYNSNVVEALLRLGSLAAEVQGVVDAIVDDLADRCGRREDPDTLWIDAAALAGQPRFVVRELLMAAWRRQDWPMQAMGFAQWDLLAEMIGNCTDSAPSALPPRQTLPGNVLAEPADGRLRLKRTAP
ncbi:MAG: tRNA lysidine(34) synthetase TilS [Pirellulales bacterium]|nr:tRNA lysidine(34) synthetase TilS [Pirellulales bacterium]